MWARGLARAAQPGRKEGCGWVDGEGMSALQRARWYAVLAPNAPARMTIATAVSMPKMIAGRACSAPQHVRGPAHPGEKAVAEKDRRVQAIAGFVDQVGHSDLSQRINPISPRAPMDDCNAANAWVSSKKRRRALYAPLF